MTDDSNPISVDSNNCQSGNRVELRKTFQVRVKTALILVLLTVPWIAGHLVLKKNVSAAPHNDDWLYARSVQVLSDDGRYQHVTQHGQLAASVVSHVGWGWLFTANEFSYAGLHRSQAVAGWLICCFLFLLVQKLGCDTGPALVAVAALLVNPLFWGHTFTFMTDITALMYMSAALLCFVSSHDLQRISYLVAGSVLAALALWSRQTHVLVILVPLVVLGFRRNDFSLLQIGLRVMAITCIPLIAWAVFEFGLLVPGDQQRVSIISVKKWDAARAKQTIVYLYGLVLLLGMLLLPLAVLSISKIRNRNESGLRGNWRFAGVALIGLLAILFWTGGRGVITQSVGYFLQNAHFGPVLFADLPHPDGSWSYLGDVKWTPLAWQVITVLSILSVACVAACVTVKSRSGQRIEVPSDVQHWRFGLIVLMVGETVFMITMVTNIVDRYWLVLFVPVLLWVVTSDMMRKSVHLRRPAATMLWLVLFLLGYISVAFTHDWLVFNDQRAAQMTQWLRSPGVEARDIDLGADINGWLRTAEDYNSLQRSGDDTRSWRGHATKALAHQGRAGWDIVAVRQWRSWSTGKLQNLYVLEKRVAD
ncbi:MAG: glycosyltransferase family 39 protein [Pirellulales bacterium]